jgi:hypothetical protein
MATGVAQVMRLLQFATVRAFLKGGRNQGVVAAAHVALGRAGLAFRNGHAAPVMRIDEYKLPMASWPPRQPPETCGFA